MCIYVYILSASWKLPGRLFMASVVDITQRFRMVSVVGFLMVSVAAGNVFLWFPSLVFLWFPSRQETFSYGFRRGTFSYGFRRGK